MTLPIGSKLGPYEILGAIGAGGMGEVYRAKDPRLGREVAIKVLPASFSQDADRLRRFEDLVGTDLRAGRETYRDFPNSRDQKVGRRQASTFSIR